MIYYEDFGAKGDGKHNDFDAIFKAHAAANACGETVSAKPGATYYIKETGAKTAVIKTDVCWRGASFIIDDREISGADREGDGSYEIFSVESDYAPKTLTQENSPALKRISDAGIKTTDKKIDLGLGYPALLIIYDDDKPFYIRYGFNSASVQRELVVTDKDGNIEDGTECLFDYTSVTKIEVFRADDKPITIEGGSFVSKTPRVQNEAGGYRTINRGFLISRSNVTIKDIEHRLDGEIPKGEIINGVPFYTDGYYGFYKFYHVNNVELNNALASSHIMYCASYDLIAHDSNNVRFVNVREPLETFEDDSRWGIMGSNFCKNLSYDGCYLSRFDAHAGVYNATIRNSTVACLRLTGGGNFYMENSTVRSKAYGRNRFLMLREDYGSTWRGKITLKNCHHETSNGAKVNELILVWASWINHNFGYQPVTPQIEIDGFTQSSADKVRLIKVDNYDKSLPEVDNYSLESFGDVKNENRYTAPESIIIKNNHTGINYVLDESDFFKNTKIIK